MNQRDKYRLGFAKITGQERNVFYSCDFNASVDGSVCLGLLLQSLSDMEPEMLLEEVEFVIKGTNYEEDYFLDQDSSIWIIFSSTDALIYYAGGLSTYTINLLDLKQLLEEWIAFVQQ